MRTRRHKFLFIHNYRIAYLVQARSVTHPRFQPLNGKPPSCVFPISKTQSPLRLFYKNSPNKWHAWDIIALCVYVYIVLCFSKAKSQKYARHSIGKLCHFEPRSLSDNQKRKPRLINWWINMFLKIRWNTTKHSKYVFENWLKHLKIPKYGWPKYIKKYEVFVNTLKNILQSRAY